jgi:hypothetical protein
MNEGLVELRLWRQFVAVAQELHFAMRPARAHPALQGLVAFAQQQMR